jgi:CPW-WPC domain-containing protein
LLVFAACLLASAGVRAETPLEAIAVAEGIPIGDLLCVKDFSGCPSGWADYEGSCFAPLGYDGLCPGEVAFEGSPKEKSLLAARCGADFPCVGACSQDFSAEFDFAEYSGPCVETDLSVFSAREKAAWGKICGATWPCKK